MNHFPNMQRTALVLLILATACLALGASPPQAKPESPLAALQWLEGKWEATATVPGGGLTLRESFYEWSPNHMGLRFWSFATPSGGTRAPYVDGWYFWDAAAGKIRFGYVDPGAYYEGEVRIEGNVYDHTFSSRNASGALTRWRFTLTRAADGTMPLKIYADKEGQWAEFASLIYRRKK